MRGGWCPGRRLAAGLLGAVLLLAVPLPAAADDTAEVGTSVEAWYQGSILDEDDPLCILPCPELAIPEGPQPEDTLHVGVSGGRETARTYFNLDLSGLPSGPTVTGGTVRLPVAGPDAGTTTPDLADLVACAVDGFVQPAEGGSPHEAPPIDCSMSAPLELDDDGEVFTLDLAPLTTGEPLFGDFSVAVVASDEARDEAGTWRVAFHGRNRDTDDAEPITAAIRYRVGDDDDIAMSPPTTTEPEPQRDTEPAPPPSGETSQPQTFDRSEGAASAPGFEDPPMAADAESDEPVVDEPAVAADEPPPDDGQMQPLVAAPLAVDLAYPQVWLLPLVFLAVGGLLTRALSRDYEVELDDPAPAA